MFDVYAISNVSSGLGLALRVYNSLESGNYGEGRIVKPLNLLGDAEPLSVRARLLKSSEIVQILSKNRQVMHVVEKLGGLSKISAAQLIEYGKRKLLVLFLNNDTRLNLVVIDLDTGKILPHKLVPIKRHSGRTCNLTSPNVEAVKYVRRILELLGNSGIISVNNLLIQRVLTTYTQLQACQEFNMTSYRLMVPLEHDYTTLAYYFEDGSCYDWYMLGYLVYRVCAKGLFYVNPGEEVRLIADKSYYEVNPPLMNCDFKDRVYSTDISVSIRADGLAALIDCPVTTKVSAWAVIAVNKWSNVFKDGGGTK